MSRPETSIAGCRSGGASRAVGSLLLVLLGVAWGGCGGGADPAGRDRLRVAVSVPPQAWLVERLAGDRVEVQVMVPPGSSPETYDPAPRQLFFLERAELYLAVGHPALTFERRLLEDRPALRRIEMLASAERSGTAWPPEDPHLWLDAEAMTATAVELAASLEELDPEWAAAAGSRLEVVKAEIAAVDDRLRVLLAPVAGRRFVVDHPAWTVFERRYGLLQEAVEREGHEPSPARLVELVGQLEGEVGTVFVDRGAPQRAARALAAELDARVVELDPLSPDWGANLVQTAELLRAAVEEPPAAPAE